MAKTRLRIKGRFFLIILVAIGLVVGLILIAQARKRNGEIQFGSIDAELEVSAAVIRDETVVMTEQYEKILFEVIEGETVSNDQVIAELYKRGYQDETMISLLNLQKQIYAYQLQLLGDNRPAELTELNANIATLEEQIRTTARGEGELDMLSLEQSLKSLQNERITLLASLVSADATLNGMYSDLNAQLETQNSWKRDVKNTAGTGVVSFYFDGYEQVLSASKLSTINSAVVNSVVRGNNTSATTSTTSESPLYRIINSAHWYIAFVTKASEAMRLVPGETYYVTFGDYSDTVYTATARETTVSEQNVVNILEFNTDIGKMIGTRTVSATISKSAQGLVVPLSAIEIVEGVPGINISYGDTPLRVEIEILSQDEKRAVIRARNEQDNLSAGQKFYKS
ncbi:MAG: HlyD family efflux transporter periplasmic adaptor subunit [Clostridia bacterium]|nr:HlyD family efflux transporter periplasmic adaptor subunit [Clostridia bacterium]